MKKLLIAATLLMLGCQTANFERNMTATIKYAAFTGTAISLDEHPEWRSQFNEVRMNLEVIEQQSIIDFTLVMAIVYRLPIKELKSSEARIIITAATMLLQDFGGSVDLSTEKIKPVVTALKDGIALGMLATPEEVRMLRREVR